MWRKLNEREEVVTVAPGVCLTIPVGTHFQFRSFGPRAARRARYHHAALARRRRSLRRPRQVAALHRPPNPPSRTRSPDCHQGPRPFAGSASARSMIRHASRHALSLSDISQDQENNILTMSELFCRMVSWEGVQGHA